MDSGGYPYFWLFIRFGPKILIGYSYAKNYGKEDFPSGPVTLPMIGEVSLDKWPADERGYEHLAKCHPSMSVDGFVKFKGLMKAEGWTLMHEGVDRPGGDPMIQAIKALDPIRVEG